ncbi:hypothetical protein HYW21_05960 [Candidatus Woesearchaeota archaeon]|nr:hypothetical protein [Candidatus Woesearchaeota archaeon]
MQRYTVMNSKEIKELMKVLEKAYGFRGKLDYVSLMNEHERIVLVNKEVFNVELSKLKIDALGMYFGQYHHGTLRLSIEGSQCIGAQCTHHIVELQSKEVVDWIRGNDIAKEAPEGFVLVKHNNDFYGCGKAKQNVILNFVPKERRVK